MVNHPNRSKKQIAQSRDRSHQDAMLRYDLWKTLPRVWSGVVCHTPDGSTLDGLLIGHDHDYTGAPATDGDSKYWRPVNFRDACLTSLIAAFAYEHGPVTLCAEFGELYAILQSRMKDHPFAKPIIIDGQDINDLQIWHCDEKWPKHSAENR